MDVVNVFWALVLQKVGFPITENESNRVMLCEDGAALDLLQRLMLHLMRPTTALPPGSLPPLMPNGGAAAALASGPFLQLQQQQQQQPLLQAHTMTVDPNSWASGFGWQGNHGEAQQQQQQQQNAVHSTWPLNSGWDQLSGQWQSIAPAQWQAPAVLQQAPPKYQAAREQQQVAQLRQAAPQQQAALPAGQNRQALLAQVEASSQWQQPHWYDSIGLAEPDRLRQQQQQQQQAGTGGTAMWANAIGGGAWGALGAGVAANSAQHPYPLCFDGPREGVENYAAEMTFQQQPASHVHAGHASGIGPWQAAEQPMQEHPSPPVQPPFVQPPWQSLNRRPRAPPCSASARPSATVRVRARASHQAAASTEGAASAQWTDQQLLQQQADMQALWQQQQQLLQAHSMLEPQQQNLLQQQAMLDQMVQYQFQQQLFQHHLGQLQGCSPQDMAGGSWASGAGDPAAPPSPPPHHPTPPTTRSGDAARTRGGRKKGSANPDEQTPQGQQEPAGAALSGRQSPLSAAQPPDVADAEGAAGHAEASAGADYQPPPGAAGPAVASCQQQSGSSPGREPSIAYDRQPRRIDSFLPYNMKDFRDNNFDAKESDHYWVNIALQLQNRVLTALLGPMTCEFRRAEISQLPHQACHSQFSIIV